jgi:hypothetical protein
MSNVVIDIAAQFTGKKAFSASEKAIDNLSRSIKRAALGGGIAALMGSSVKAFAEDEKAAAMLGNTLKNLGLETFTASIEAMIDKTQLATGVLDEQLRPAFQKLVTSTGDAIKAQELLQLALDVSAGSTVDLVTVSSDIANVMAGNNKGLKKYALGLSQLELKTMSATDVQLKFLEVYGGASEAASKTFAVSLNRIKASVEMARESLGKGLVDGLMTATGSQNIDELQKKILDFGKSAGNAFKTLGGVVRENLGLLKSLAITFAAIWTASKVIAGIEATRKIIDALNKSYKLLRATAVGTAIAQMAVLNPLGALAYGAALVAGITVATISIDKLGDAFGGADDEANKLLNTTKAIGNFQMSTGTVLDLGAINRNVDAIYLKKAAAAKIKADKAAAAAKIKADKLAAANATKLAKAQSIFNLEKIQIEAALKGKISEEEKTRLLLLQAIADEDADKAEALSKKLEDIQEKNAKIAADLLAIGEAKDPFATWAGSLSLAIAALGKVGLGISAINGILVPGVDYNPAQSKDRNYDEKVKAAEKAAADKAAADKAKADKEAADRAAAVTSIFEPDDTIDEILAKVENVAEAAFAAAEAAAASVTETQTTVDALAASATNGSPVAGTNFNPSQSRDRNYDSGFSTQTPVTINVTNTGSVIMQDEFVKVINDAVTVGLGQGLKIKPPGSLPDFE